MYRNLIISLSIFCMTTLSLAQTFVSGNISGGTWTKANSPYIVIGDINAGYGLTINPGVEVLFDSTYWFKAGKLTAEGTEEDSIIFSINSGNQAESWQGLDITEYGPGGHSLKYCKIELSDWGLNINESDISIDHCKISNNKRGISSYESRVDITNTLIQNNSASSGAGGIDISDGRLTIYNSTFIGNHGRNGGGINTDNSDVIIANSSFISNTATNTGAAFDISGENTFHLISNCSFKDNLSGASPLYLGYKTDISLYNCVFYYSPNINSEPWWLGNRYYIRNSIFDNCPIDYQVTPTINSPNINYSNIEGGFAGTGNIDADPLFVDPENNNFQLQQNSPCINAGHPNGIFNDYDSTRNDMGMYGGSGIWCVDRVDCGYAGIGQSNPSTLQIFNTRNEAISLDSWDFSDNENFSTGYNRIPIMIDPFSAYEFSVYFHPVSSGKIEGNVEFYSANFLGASSSPIVLSGMGGFWSGEASGTWKKEHSPIYVYGDIVVPKLKTLTIESGVTVIIDPSNEWGRKINMEIAGSLIAEGSENDSIIFSLISEFEDGWEGIRFRPWSYVSSELKMDYCRITEAEIGISIISNGNDNTIISNCNISHNKEYGVEFLGGGRSGGIIQNCEITKNGRYGIHCFSQCYTYDTHASPQILSNTISGNLESGIYIHAHGGSPSSWSSTEDHCHASPVIFENTIDNNGYAIDCVSWGVSTQGSFSTHYSYAHVKPEIYTNTIINNENGIRLHCDYSPGYTQKSFSDVKVKKNTFFNNPNIQLEAVDSTALITASSNIFWQYQGVSAIASNEAVINSVYNNFEQAIEGTGNISSDPYFVDSYNSDFHILSSSPCIDAGSPLDDPDPDDTRADMGAFHYNQTLADFSLITPANNAVLRNTRQHLEWNHSTTDDGHPVSYDLHYSKDNSFDSSSTTIIDSLVDNSYLLSDGLDDFSTYYWKVKAKNKWTLEKWSSQTWKFTINTDSLAPALVYELPAIQMREDKEYLLSRDFWQEYIEDNKWPDSTLTAALAGSGHLEVLRDSLNYTIRPAADWFGADTLTLSVADPVNLELTTPAYFIVKSVNDIPTLDCPDSIQMTIGSDYILNLWEFADDIETLDEDLVFESSIADDISLNFNSITGRLTLNTAAFTGDSELYVSVFDDSSSAAYDTISVNVRTNTGIEKYENLIPKDYVLLQNFPNPFNPVTKIGFGLPKKSDVRVEVYNILGVKVSELLNESRQAGYHFIDFNASDMSSGTYFYRIMTKRYSKIKKMILLK